MFLKIVKSSNYWLYALIGITIISTIIGMLAYSKEQTIIEKKVVENLQLNHQLSIVDIKGNMESLSEEIVFIAADTKVVEYCKKSIVDTQYASDANSSFESWSKNIIEHFGFYDFMIINSNGDLLYTVAKESDLGTNLINGPYSSSGLGVLFQKIKASKSLKGEDFSPYEPSNNQLAGFIGVPIFEDNKLIGVLAIQLPTSFEKLNIGVHIDHIQDYIITSKYIFQHNGLFKSLDSVNFIIPSTPSITKKGDSLLLFTPFEIRNLKWGILSIVPPVVYRNNTSWDRIWFDVFLAILGSLLISVIIIKLLTNSIQLLSFTKNDIVLVQNTWKQFLNKEHSLGTDFYYRVKNKLDIKLGDNDLDIELLGKEIEQLAIKIIASIDNEKVLLSNLSTLAEHAASSKISISSLKKMGKLFIESLEDELGHKLPTRAKLSWNKISNSLIVKLISLINKK